jgi:hypothetical protein
VLRGITPRIAGVGKHFAGDERLRDGDSGWSGGACATRATALVNGGLSNPNKEPCDEKLIG